MTSRSVRTAAFAGALLLLTALPAAATWESSAPVVPATIGTATLAPVGDATAQLTGSTVTGSWTAPHPDAEYRVRRTIGNGSPTPVANVSGGTFTDDLTVAGTPVPFASIEAGSDHTCGLDTTGQAWCWGSGGTGQLGNGTTANQSRPTRVDTTASFTAIAAGVTHTCAIDTAKQAWCWGNGGNGRLGTGNADSRLRPTRVYSTTSFTAIAAGDQHTCAIDTAGVAWCWGAGSDGQLGTGWIWEIPRPSPEQTDTAARFTSISAGLYSTCAIDTAKKAWCWGMGSFGQLGIGTTRRIGERPMPVDTTETFTVISVGMYSACAAAVSGDAWCWGYNSSGELGRGTTSDSLGPVRVDTARRTTTISIGDQHSCNVDTAGTTWCAGRSRTGALGTGTQVQWSPAAVIAPTTCQSGWEKASTDRCRPSSSLPIRYTLDYSIRGWTPDHPASFTAAR